MIIIHTVTPQNRLALQFIFAYKGRVCVLTGKECCTYIADILKLFMNRMSTLKERQQKQNSSIIGICGADLKI